MKRSIFELSKSFFLVIGNKTLSMAVVDLVLNSTAIVFCQNNNSTTTIRRKWET